MVISRYCIKRIVIAFVRVKLATTLAVLVERGNHAHEEVKVEHPLVRDLKRKVGDNISPVPHRYEGAIHEMVSRGHKRL
ncbi:unnamed protein product [Didymodactylos carnosus]|uniref:Uncharacterized protein n=1 Tax=Didymodactylos carnosus TaxID=1234261 RepID=A0A8S2E707_9BILA|nr:unnamed protein product [Didymodactylos carnosus]CAF3844370.1 unnamed protein product [Didymodactylos carnosus]